MAQFFELGLFLLLLATGYVVGRIIEQRHYASIRLRERRYRDVLAFPMRFAPDSVTPQRAFLVHGTVVVSALEGIEVHYPEVRLDEWVVMPDHIHLLAWLGDGPHGPGSRHGLEDIIGKLKAAVTRDGRRAGVLGPRPLWQRGFYVRLVRDPAEVERVRRYIRDNPANWGTRR